MGKNQQTRKRLLEIVIHGEERSGEVEREGEEARWIAHRTEWGRGEALRREETGWGTGMTVGFGC